MGLRLVLQNFDGSVKNSENLFGPGRPAGL